MRELQVENQRLRDENNRLKGEQGKPDFKPNKKFKNISSEKERGGKAAKKNVAKSAEIVLERTEVVTLERKTLPADARFKGYAESIVEEVEFRREIIRFRRERYYSASTRMSYTAPVPQGYAGSYGPKLKAWALDLYYRGGMSEPKLLGFLHSIGLSLSAGQLSDWLIHDHQQFEQESAAVLLAGLAATPYSHLDSTQSRLNGVAMHCHVLTNPLYTYYLTLPHKDRVSIIRVLMGGRALSLRYDTTAHQLLLEWKLGQKWLVRFPYLPGGVGWSETEFEAWAQKQLGGLAPQKLRLVRDALAISGYRAQSEVPVIEWLVCDDAPQFETTTKLLALCWVHKAAITKNLNQPWITIKKS